MPISGLIFGTIGQYIGPSNAVLIGSLALIGWALYLLTSRALGRAATPSTS
jgi:hypothetical protein